jgi:hypothetical protein
MSDAESPRWVACCVGVRRLLVVLASCGSGETARPAPVRVEPTPIVADATPSTADAPADAGCVVARATLGPGLTVERWPIAGTPAAGGPPCIDVVRADPARYRLRALTDDGTERNGPRWAHDFDLIAVTNAGMFHDDGAPVGLVIDRGKARGHDNIKMSGYLAWDPVSSKDAPVIVAGRSCPGFDLDRLRERYRSLVQSYRFVGCDGAALPWQDPKQYSAAGIGVDREGRIVLLHARAAVTMKELSASLAAHDLAGAIFLEGGPEASLVVAGPEGSLDRVGSYETFFLENDSNTRFWALPNVIGLVRR